MRNGFKRCSAGLLAALAALPGGVAAGDPGVDAPRHPASGPGSVVAPDNAASAGEQRLFLDVHINGNNNGAVAEFVKRDDMLYARPGALRDAGLIAPPAGPDDQIPLGAMPDIRWRLDEASQSLEISAPTERITPTRLRVMQDQGKEVPYLSGYGVAMDYDLVGQSSQAGDYGSGWFEGRAFAPAGVLSSGFLSGFGAAVARRDTIRLDTTFVHSDPDSMRRYRFGDFVSGGLAWTRPVYMGGVRVSSDFTMRPDIITFPIPSVSGAATAPSTVDVLINGQNAMSRDVHAGPFEVPQLPVVTGAGTITLNVTDALGRQTTQTSSFYASSALLASGLQTWSVEAGELRRNRGVVSNDYSDTAASGSYRRGISDHSTIEAHAEAGPDIEMVGAGIVTNVANVAVASLTAAGSLGSDHQGGLVSAGIERVGRVFSVNAKASFAGGNFSDVGSLDGYPFPWRQIQAGMGLSLGDLGSFGIAYALVDGDAIAPSKDRPWQHSDYWPDGYLPGSKQRQRVLTASYSVQIRGNASLYATTYTDFSGGGQSGVMVGIVIPFGSHGASASASVGRSDGDASYQIESSRSATNVGDWGYRAYRSDGLQTHDMGELQYKSPWMLTSIGADRMGDESSLRAQARGSIVATDGSLFASNIIQDSFAVVDTDGVPGVRVRYENRDMGRTDGSGRLPVPELSAFQINHLSIDPTDIPADVSVAAADLRVRPIDRTGVVVKFPVRVSRGALIRLVNERGEPLPIGSELVVNDSAARLAVGYDGESYAEDLLDANVATVYLPDGRQCTARFDYRPVAGDVQTIGPVICRSD